MSHTVLYCYGLLTTTTTTAISYFLMPSSYGQGNEPRCWWCFPVMNVMIVLMVGLFRHCPLSFFVVMRTMMEMTLAQATNVSLCWFLLSNSIQFLRVRILMLPISSSIRSSTYLHHSTTTTTSTITDYLNYDCEPNRYCQLALQVCIWWSMSTLRSCRFSLGARSIFQLGSETCFLTVGLSFKKGERERDSNEANQVTAGYENLADKPKTWF